MPPKNGKIIGVTTITRGYRISLLKDVKLILESKSGNEIKEGDKIVFSLDSNRNIIINPA